MSRQGFRASQEKIRRRFEQEKTMLEGPIQGERIFTGASNLYDPSELTKRLPFSGTFMGEDQEQSGSQEDHNRGFSSFGSELLTLPESLESQEDGYNLENAAVTAVGTQDHEPTPENNKSGNEEEDQLIDCDAAPEDSESSKTGLLDNIHTIEVQESGLDEDDTQLDHEIEDITNEAEDNEDDLNREDEEIAKSTVIADYDEDADDEDDEHDEHDAAAPADYEPDSEDPANEIHTSDKEFEVERILDYDEKAKMYYVKWKGYKKSTWELRTILESTFQWIM
ncbi:hypothetical protein FA95DRAFT_1573304 [Auriscalpium vulgare]|uniref:Uncharacterized protein n=1 Tax=Auriscalpium vulgare TaxID=40419 RepID=A0ACB8RRF3_9AGAM|nr:hypothetical protein FA95DRAFT_1573304 [Auriscalpium vulgare]